MVRRAAGSWRTIAGAANCRHQSRGRPLPISCHAVAEDETHRSSPPAPLRVARLARSLGCCYNYGEEDHIAANCTQPTKCVRCGGSDHISQPRTPSNDAPPDRRAPAVHRDVAGDAGGRDSGEAPSPRSANDGGRTWHDVVSRQSTGTSTAFTVPFVRTGHGVGNDRTTDEPPTATYALDVCYLSPSPEMV
jgi:hypothetical protein